jgi:hypothetical protein
MANVVTASFTDNVSVVAAAVLARGSTARGTLDLRAKFGAYLFIKIGRGGTTALTNGVDVLLRRMLNNGAAGTVGGVHPAGIPLLSSTVACNGNTTIAGTNVAAGDVEIHTAAVTNFAAGDLICIQDAGGGVTRLEWARVSKLTVASGTGLTLDSPVLFAHTTAQADTVRNKADVFAPVWLAGGSLYEVIFDYGDDAAGESVTVSALAQSYDSDNIA